MSHNTHTQYTSSCVRLGSHLSDVFPVCCGVYQGSVLSPTLFHCYQPLIEEAGTAQPRP